MAHDLVKDNFSGARRICSVIKRACNLLIYLALASSVRNCADTIGKPITASHTRYLTAIRTLAQVRRLPVPNVQVNIAREQVNVAAITPVQSQEG